MKKIYLFNNYKKVMSPEEIFSQFLNCEFMSKIFHLLPLFYFYPIFTCVDPDPYSEYGSRKLLNTDPITDPDPQHCLQR